MENSPARRKDQFLTQETFNSLLTWLDPDRDKAGYKYEEIRQRLIKIFACRGCSSPEDLADETINRVAKKAWELADIYVGNPALYFYGVANNVHLEHLRRRPVPIPPPSREPDEEANRAHECLERCMQELTPENRELVLTYYQGEKKAKVDHRKEVAERLGIALNALRIRAHRIRTGLRQCVTHCISEAAAD